MASLLAGQANLGGQVQEQELKDSQEQPGQAETSEVHHIRLFIGKSLCSIRRLPRVETNKLFMVYKELFRFPLFFAFKVIIIFAIKFYVLVFLLLPLGFL